MHRWSPMGSVPDVRTRVACSLLTSTAHRASGWCTDSGRPASLKFKICSQDKSMGIKSNGPFARASSDVSCFVGTEALG